MQAVLDLSEKKTPPPPLVGVLSKDWHRLEIAGFNRRSRTNHDASMAEDHDG